MRIALLLSLTAPLILACMACSDEDASVVAAASSIAASSGAGGAGAAVGAGGLAPSGGGGGDGGALGAGGAPQRPLPSTPLENPEDCTPERPTWLGGDVFGHPDERALNAIIGIDHADPATGKRIDASGVPCDGGGDCCAGYSWCFRLNPSIDPAGSDDAALDRRWGKCVSAKVVQVFLEIYPKNAEGITDWARYGEAVHQYQPVTPGKPNEVVLRLPIHFEADAVAGNTGTVHGYVTCNGAPAPPETVTRVRAWSEELGPACGIQGFSASAHELAAGNGGTFYRISYLAAGQCNAPSQEHRLYMDVVCGGSTKSQKKYVSIVKGMSIPLDWAF